MVRPDIYFVITRNCNLACRHCYMEAAPKQEGTTISQENFQKVIANLPQKTNIRLVLSGGEVFTIEDRLYSFLEHIKDVNASRSKFCQILPEVQTNGFWAQRESTLKTIKRLEKLEKLGVKNLDITSEDEFHEEQGINQKELQKLYVMAQAYFPELNLRGPKSISRIMPIGRARKNNLNERYEGIYDCVDFINGDLNIDENGDAYACCFYRFKLPGNLIDTPFNKILKDSKRDPRLKALNKRGIRGLMRADGFSQGDIRDIILSYGECGTCAKVYKNEGRY